MSDNKDEDKKVSFWQTMPGCITAIGGLVSIVVAAVVALATAGFINPPYATVTDTPSAPVAVTTVSGSTYEVFTFPAPIGNWAVNANNYEGVLVITSVQDGKVIGTIFDAPMVGNWNEITGKITFTRKIASNSDPNAHQIYYGDFIKQEGMYILTGTFEQFTLSGKTGPFNWSAKLWLQR